MCLHMNFLLAELTKCLHPLSRVCGSACISPTRCQRFLFGGSRGIIISETSACLPTLYTAGQCSVFFVQRIVMEVLCHTGSWTCTPLPPSLPILPELQDPMRLEVTHPDLGAQLPVISIVEQVTEGKRVLIDCTDSFQSLLMTLGDKENY